MDLNSDTASEMLTEAYCEAEMAVEYIDGMYLTNTMASTSCDADGVMTLVLNDPSSLNNDECISLSSEELDFTKESMNNIAQQTGNQLVIGNGRSGPNSQQTTSITPNTLYTIQLLENELQASLADEEDVDDVISLCKEDKNPVKLDTIKMPPKVVPKIPPPPKPELEAIDTTTRLEEFMDVVTTYKCKFCRFSCPWKSGLMSHIRNCHMDGNKKAETSPPVVAQNYSVNLPEDQTKRQSALVEHDYSQSPNSTDKEKNVLPFNREMVIFGKPAPIEKNVFVCGQCNKGFEFLAECKNHMINDHNLKVQGSKSPKNNKKRSRPHTAKVTSCEAPGNVNDECPSLKGPFPVNEESREQELSQFQIAQQGFAEAMEAKRKKARKEKIEDKPFRCNEKGCGYRFSSENHLMYHTSCHSFGSRPFICPECGETSENWRGLSLHLWKEHSVDVDLYSCEECGYKTYSLFKLDNHKKIHSEERSFICPICTKGFKQISQLRNHVVIHADKKNMPEKRWYSEQTCEICNRNFADSKCLKKHQQAVHSKLKPFVCTYCGHMSARKAMLQLHMRQHTGEKPFLCELCEYRTGDHNSLRRHKMRHTGTKPYKCPHCPYACIQAISYKTHMKSKHPGLEGLYACSLCPFRSVSKDNYFNHMSDHNRGAIPIPGVDVLDGSAPETTTLLPQMLLPEDTLQQLEEILPGNMTAAQLIYSCLNALSQENGAVDLPIGVTASSTSDGLQTITIQLPPEDVGKEQLLFTVEQDGSTTVLLPNDCEEETNENIEMEILQPIVTMEENESDSSIDSAAFSELKEGDIVVTGAFTSTIEDSSSKRSLLSSTVKCCA